jgi:PTH1 family peptidyl-tRNA hydrolase
MILVVGLGNPGTEYARNRHNIGFMAADELVRRHSFGPWRAKFQGEFAEGTIAGTKVLVLKPMTYMNLSGQSVAAAARFLKVPVEDIVVIHDELDLPPGRLRVKRGGGAGGHNGLKSIDQHLGQNYRRVRLGIGHPGDKDRVSGYVLHDFAKADQAWLDPLLDAVADALPQLFKGDEAGFMNRVSTATQPPKQKKEKPAEAPKPAAPQAPTPENTPSLSGAIADALRAALARKKD